MSAAGPGFDVMRYARANRFQRMMRGTAATRPGSWLFIRVLDHVDRPIFRWTRGRHTLTSIVTGLPVGVLTTTGARSGQPRRSPLLVFPTSEGLVVVASNYGQARHPSWYHNLRAHPEAEMTIRGRRHRIRARQVEGEQRERIWREGLEIYPGWTTYERWTGGRRIPILLLEPVEPV